MRAASQEKGTRVRAPLDSVTVQLLNFQLPQTYGLPPLSGGAQKRIQIDPDVRRSP